MTQRKVNALRIRLRLEAIENSDEFAEYQKQVRQQNKARRECGVSELPLLLRELRARCPEPVVDSFLQEHRPVSPPRLVTCQPSPSYAAGTSKLPGRD